MSNRIPTSEIGKIVATVKKWNPSQSRQLEPFNYIDLSSVDQKGKRIVGALKIHPKEAPSRARQLVQEGDVLVSTVRPNLNGVTYVPRELDGATASTGFCVLRPKEKELDGRYLFYWVQTSKFIEEMVRLATGANYPAISDRIVKASEIPLPSLAEQKRIAAILDTAEAIRRKRRQAIKLADEFLRSVFLDMFGDPAANPKAWQRKKIRQLGKAVTGNTPSRQIPENFGDHIEWIKSDNINTPSHILTRAEEALSVAGEKLGRTVPANSTLVTCIAGTPECIGNAALTDRKVAFNQQINAIVPFDNINPYFLYMLVTISKRIIQRASTNSMKGMVSKGIFQEIELIFPPCNLQKKFGSYFYAYLNYLDKQELQLKESDNLFNSLCQNAFRGEL
jgi:type I restriction enzyme S subunit